MEICGVCGERTGEMVVQWFCPASISTSVSPEEGATQPGDGTRSHVHLGGRVHHVMGPPVWTGTVILHTCTLKGR